MRKNESNPRLLNTLEIDYPRENLEIIVASDGSTDKTNDIVRRYSQEGIKLLAFDKRRGKEFAQKDAVASAKGDVLVFTDVATQLRGIRIEGDRQQLFRPERRLREQRGPPRAQ